MAWWFVIALGAVCDVLLMVLLREMKRANAALALATDATQKAAAWAEMVKKLSAANDSQATEIFLLRAILTATYDEDDAPETRVH